MGQSRELVEVLKEIRDELRAVRTELGARAARMATSGIRTELVDRRALWRRSAPAVGGVAGLALVLGLALRDRPVRESAPVAVSPQISAMPVAAVLPAPTAVASLPAPAKKRVKPAVADRSPAEVASEDDETIAFPPPPRRVRSHRLSYGPVASEPAKL